MAETLVKGTWVVFTLAESLTCVDYSLFYVTCIKYCVVTIVNANDRKWNKMADQTLMIVKPDQWLRMLSDRS